MFNDDTSNINGIEIHVPKCFEGIIPVSPNRSQFDYEPYAFLGIKEGIKEGDTVFDLGVSYGVMKTLFAKMIGENGRIYSFEANSSVINMINTIIDANGFASRVTINNNLVSNVDDLLQSFYVVPGFNSVASSANADVKRVGGIEKKVRSIRLDDYCEKNQLVPDFVKIDIEGAEYVAVEGFLSTLKKYKPILQIETHGKRIDGIGGNLKALLEKLEEIGYEIYDLLNGKVTNSDEYSRTMNRQTGYLYCTINLSESTIELLNKGWKSINRDNSSIHKYRPQIIEVRKHVENNRFSEANELLKTMIDMDDLPAEILYLYGFVLHNIKEYDKAYEYYSIALERGYDEFWIRYNRGSLLILMNSLDGAKVDILRAWELNKNHQGVRFLLNEYFKYD